MEEKKNMKKMKNLILTLACAFALVFCSVAFVDNGMVVHASTVMTNGGDTGNNGGSKDYGTQGATALGEAVSQSKLASKGKGKTYEIQNGGYIEYENLIDEGAQSKGYLNESNFNLLTDKSKKQFLTDFNKDIKVRSEGGAKYNDNTIADWWHNMQNCNGVGSQLINSVTQSIQPDFVRANGILKPFQKPMETILGVMCVVIVTFLAVVMALDISYLALPPFRMLCDNAGGEGNNSGNGGNGPAFISYEAKSAVNIAEASGDGDKGNKVLVFEYLKKRIVMLFALGLCLAYLLNGQIWTAVGWFLNLFNGILGF